MEKYPCIINGQANLVISLISDKVKSSSNHWLLMIEIYISTCICQNKEQLYWPSMIGMKRGESNGWSSLYKLMHSSLQMSVYCKKYEIWIQHNEQNVMYILEATHLHVTYIDMYISLQKPYKGQNVLFKVMDAELKVRLKYTTGALKYTVKI